MKHSSHEIVDCRAVRYDPATGFELWVTQLVRGERYQISRSSDLMQWNEWQVFTAGPDQQQFFDPESIAPIFFRVARLQ